MPTSNCDTSAIKTAQTAYDEARGEWSSACNAAKTAEQALANAQATYDAAVAEQTTAKAAEQAAWEDLEATRNTHSW